MSDRTTAGKLPGSVVVSTNPTVTKSKTATKVTSNSHAVQHDADNAIFDTTSNVFVKPEDTDYRP